MIIGHAITSTEITVYGLSAKNGEDWRKRVASANITPNTTDFVKVTIKIIRELNGNLLGWHLVFLQLMCLLLI